VYRMYERPEDAWSMARTVGETDAVHMKGL